MTFLNLFYIIFFLCLKLWVIAAMESSQGKPSCEFNVNLAKWLSSLAPSGITTNWNCLTPITINVEGVDNVGEFDNVEEDKESQTNMEHTQWHRHQSSTKATCFKRCYPYMHMKILIWSNCLGNKNISTWFLMHL